MTATHSESEAAQSAGMPPPPHPALRKFDRFIGTWDMTGRLVGSNEETIKGRTTFEFLPGGYFVLQTGTIDFGQFKVANHELIRYDPETDTFPSTVYPSMFGQPLPYLWKLEGDNLTIETDYLGATFHGSWNENGTVFSGGWRPNPGHENDPGNIAYDIWGSRTEE